MKLSKINESINDIDKNKLMVLWYENDAGEKFVPDFKNPDGIPEGFIYQHSQFPLELRHGCLRAVVPEEVESCPHPEEFIKIDHGIIDSMEGRTCEKCGGYQSKNCGEEWPNKWDANGSREIFAGTSSWSEDLVLAMANSGDFSLSESILIAANSCERCMNALGHKYGLDWGYEEGCDEWNKCGTECEFCVQPNNV